MSPNLAKKPANLEIVRHDPKPDPSPGKSGSFKKRAFKVLAVLAVLAAVYFGASWYVGRSAWNSLSESLDAAFGAGSWKADGRRYDILSRTFTVKGFSLSLPDSAASW